MKKNILMFFLGILTSICIGAGVSNSELLIVKPAIPKNIHIKEYYGKDAVDIIKKLHNQGYVLKGFYSSGVHNYGILVMEKY